MGVKVIRKQALDIVLKIAISPGSAMLAITMLDAYKQSSRADESKRTQDQADHRARQALPSSSCLPNKTTLLARRYRISRCKWFVLIWQVCGETWVLAAAADKSSKAGVQRNV